MSSKWRRFEVLLPLQFNDAFPTKSDEPAPLLVEAVLEIVDHFGAASYETQKVEGHHSSSEKRPAMSLALCNTRMISTPPAVGR
jgi:hypothetical protein